MRIEEQPPDNACFFLDVDGTLIDLAPTPDAVVVPDGLRRDLERLQRRFAGALALVSGRSIANLDALFAPLVLLAAGVHGAELRLPGAAQTAEGTKPIPVEVWSALSSVISRFPGTLAENKAYSYAVHYRAVPESGPALRVALDALLADEPAAGLTILPGHFVYELKRPDFNKGAAIRTFMTCATFAGRIPIFIGDDVTDIPAIAAATELGGRGYAVKSPLPGAAGTFASPAEVRHWIAGLAEAGRARR